MTVGMLMVHTMVLQMVVKAYMYMFLTLASVQRIKILAGVPFQLWKWWAMA